MPHAVPDLVELESWKRGTRLSLLAFRLPLASAHHFPLKPSPTSASVCTLLTYALDFPTSASVRISLLVVGFPTSAGVCTLPLTCWLSDFRLTSAHHLPVLKIPACKVFLKKTLLVLSDAWNLPCFFLAGTDFNRAGLTN